MKKALFATMLGLAASTTSFGQGHVSFDNYYTFGSTGAPIWFEDALGNQVLVPIGGPVALYYQLGTAANPALTGTFLKLTTIGSGATGPGYYNAGVVDILNYVSGNISFQVVANYNAHGAVSSTLVLPSIATGLATPTELDIPSFVISVPEPSAFALGSLGFAALLINRRRKT